MRRSVPVAALIVAAAATGCRVTRGSRADHRPAAAQPAPPPAAAVPATPPPPPPDEGQRADPEASRAFVASLAQPASPIVPTAAPPRVTAIALENTARGEASGMDATGPLGAVVLVEGQR